MNLSKQGKLSRVISTTDGAAGTADINGTSIDMEGFEGCLFIVTFGAIVSGAATSIKVAQSADDSTFNDLAGSAQTIADTDDEKIFYVDVYKPLDRYLRLIVDRGTQNATVTAHAIQYGARKWPTTHGTNVSGETHVSPAEGTA